MYYKVILITKLKDYEIKINPAVAQLVERILSC